MDFFDLIIGLTKDIHFAAKIFHFSNNYKMKSTDLQT